MIHYHWSLLPKGTPGVLSQCLRTLASLVSGIILPYNILIVFWIGCMELRLSGVLLRLKFSIIWQVGADGELQFQLNLMINRPLFFWVWCCPLLSQF